MKTIQVNIYELSELSDEAKETALNNFNEHNEYFWGDEAINSLKKFLEHFNCELKDWEIDFLEPYRNSFKLDIPDYMEEKTLEELKEYIETMGDYNPETLKGLGDCKFTGVCFDEPLGDGARKEYYSAKHEGDTNLEDILRAGISEWEIEVKNDCQYQMSLESFTEACEANEYMFDVNGNMV